MVTAGALSGVGDADLALRISLEQVESEVPEGGHVFGDVAGAMAGIVLAKRRVQDAVQLILDGQVTSDAVLAVPASSVSSLPM